MRTSRVLFAFVLALFTVPFLSLHAEGEQGILSEVYSFRDTFTSQSMADLGGQCTTAGTMLLKGDEETGNLFCIQPDVGTVIGAAYHNTGKTLSAEMASVLYAWKEDTRENGLSNARYVGAQFALWARMKGLDRSVLEGLEPGSANLSLAQDARESALAYYDRSIQLQEAAAALMGTPYELSAGEWAIEEGEERHVFSLQAYAEGLDELVQDVTYTVSSDQKILIQDEEGHARTVFTIDEPFVVLSPQEAETDEYVLNVTVQVASAVSTQIFESDGYQSFAMVVDQPLVFEPQTLTVRFEKKAEEPKMNTGWLVGSLGVGVLLVFVLMRKRK